MSHQTTPAMLALCAAMAITSIAPGAFALSDGASGEAAQQADGFGPAIGSQVPDIPVQRAGGGAVQLAELAGQNGIVVYFNRSLSWCPVCIAQTIEINAAREQFAERGYAVAVLTYDSPEVLAIAAERHELELMLLSDEGSAAINAFGVADPVYADPAHRAHGVPYPVAFVISPEGEVRARFLHATGLGEQRGYAVRVGIEDVLDGLDGL